MRAHSFHRRRLAAMRLSMIPSRHAGAHPKTLRSLGSMRRFKYAGFPARTSPFHPPTGILHGQAEKYAHRKRLVRPDRRAGGQAVGRADPAVLPELQDWWREDADAADP